MQHPEHVDLSGLASNPHLFTLDYIKMSSTKTRHLADMYTPKRVSLWLTSLLDCSFPTFPGESGVTAGAFLEF